MFDHQAKNLFVDVHNYRHPKGNYSFEWLIEELKALNPKFFKRKIWISVQIKQLNFCKLDNIHEFNNEHISMLCKLDQCVHDIQHWQKARQTKFELKITKQNQVVLENLFFVESKCIFRMKDL
jgi:hypothetical protein